MVTGKWTLWNGAGISYVTKNIIVKNKSYFSDPDQSLDFATSTCLSRKSHELLTHFAYEETFCRLFPCPPVFFKGIQSNNYGDWPRSGENITGLNLWDFSAEGGGKNTWILKTFKTLLSALQKKQSFPQNGHNRIFQKTIIIRIKSARASVS